MAERTVTAYLSPVSGEIARPFAYIKHLMLEEQRDDIEAYRNEKDQEGQSEMVEIVDGLLDYTDNRKYNIQWAMGATDSEIDSEMDSLHSDMTTEQQDSIHGDTSGLTVDEIEPIAKYEDLEIVKGTHPGCDNWS